MKIVQVITQMEGAGAQRVAYLLHKAFLERGHQAELWFLYRKRSAYEGKPGVRILWDRKPSGLEYLALVARLLQWMLASRPQVVVAHTYYANILGHLAGALAGVKCRVAVQHNPVESYPAAARQVDRILGTLGIYTAQVAVSDAVVKSMASYPAENRKRIHRVHNGIEFDAPGAAAPCTLLADLQAWQPKILHVGRFSKQKNHAALLEAVAQLPDVQLILIGEGELRAEVESRIKELQLSDRVRLLGEISPEDVRAVMRACDLFLFPSLYEAMPMALLEAMAAGLPIVASDIPANRETLAGAGLLVSPEPSNLSAAVVCLLSNPQKAVELGRKAFERARSFTVEAMADGYERLFPAARESRPSHSSTSAMRSGFPVCRIAGVTAHAMTSADVLAVVGNAIENRDACTLGHHNLHSLYVWHHESRMREFYSLANHVYMDGMSMILLGRLCGHPLQRRHRATYLDFLPSLTDQAARRGWRIFYLGSRPGIAEKAAEKLRTQHPGLQIRTHHGHFPVKKTGPENQRLLAEINSYAPHILLVGMGMPRQEIWILENRCDVSAPVVSSCGALMDYIAGEVPTAPRWLASLYLEWLFRMLTEPSRLWRRYLVEPWFVLGQMIRDDLQSLRQEFAAKDNANE